MYDQIDQQLHALSKEAMRGDGNSYHWYCRRFTSAVDGFVSTLPVADRDHVIQLAKAHGYGDEDRGENDCVHGLDPNCCGAGCGDLDDEYLDVRDDHARETSPELTSWERIEASISIQTLQAHVDLLKFVDTLRGEEMHSLARAKHLSRIVESADHIYTCFVVESSDVDVYAIYKSAQQQLEQTVSFL